MIDFLRLTWVLEQYIFLTAYLWFLKRISLTLFYTGSFIIDRDWDRSFYIMEDFMKLRSFGLLIINKWKII